VYDYEVGNIRPSTFIDRCWTMEHNGGTIFNKIYLSGQKDQLLPVLECQHSEPYDVLAKQYSSIPEYWARSVREMRKGVTR
jgi:hypothetical protein